MESGEQRKTATSKIPGYLATGLLALATSQWTFWGVGEMFYEGWWGAWTNRLPYLVPMLVCLLFAFVALTWPRLGGWIIILFGGAFTAWRWTLQARSGDLTLVWMLGWLPISAVFLPIGILFLLDAEHRRRRRQGGWAPPARWLRRNVRYAIVFIPAILIALGVSLFFLPLVSSRFDDRKRSARLIEGNGAALVWAPPGAGWSPGIGPSQQAGSVLPGANLSWNQIALYGRLPLGFEDKPGMEVVDATESDMRETGLCRHLDAQGTTLMAEPQDIWRMPTTQEIVRSLVRGGESAGCTWDGQSRRAECSVQPNKDAPLWDPNASAIYYYSAEEVTSGSAWYVPYTGGGSYGGAIAGQPKSAGNSRHGFRCVREP